MITPDQASTLYATAIQDGVDPNNEINLIQHVTQQVIGACKAAHARVAARAILAGADVENAILRAEITLE